MKHIIISLLIIGTVATLIGTGIVSNFSDTESANSNTFTAGTLNLQVGSADPCTEAISLSGKVPGDTGNAANWLATNSGSIAGDLTVTISAITNNENTRSEVETAAGDASADTGELGANLKIALWMDVDKDTTWSSGDYYLKSDETVVAWESGVTVPVAAYATVDSYDSDEWTDAANVAASTDAGKFRVEYDLPSGTTNVVQSDSCVFNITFTLNQ